MTIDWRQIRLILRRKMVYPLNAKQVVTEYSMHTSQWTKFATGRDSGKRDQEEWVCTQSRLCNVWNIPSYHDFKSVFSSMINKKATMILSIIDSKQYHILKFTDPHIFSQTNLAASKPTNSPTKTSIDCPNY